jgi:hypothetical protein
MGGAHRALGRTPADNGSLRAMKTNNPNSNQPLLEVLKPAILEDPKNATNHQPERDLRHSNLRQTFSEHPN